MTEKKAWIAAVPALFVAIAMCVGLLLAPAKAESTIKIGIILSMTGPFAPIGQQVKAGAFLHLQELRNYGPIQIIVKDDGGTPSNARRIAQELVTIEGAKILAGFDTTPIALAVEPVANEAKVPMVVMGATASAVIGSQYVVRTSFAQGQPVCVLAQAAAVHMQNIVTLVSDYLPGVDSETTFRACFESAGGHVLESIRSPLQNPDFAPSLQRVRDIDPKGLFVFVPVSQTGTFVRQFVERGLSVKLIGGPDLTDDSILSYLGKPMEGILTAGPYTPGHLSDINEAFVAAFEKANEGLRPNIFAVSGYDGMHLIIQALIQAGGSTNGDTLMHAMRGSHWESPRGPVTIDPDDGDIIQNIYLRTVKKRNGDYINVEFKTFPNVKDPVRTGRKWPQQP